LFVLKLVPERVLNASPERVPGPVRTVLQLVPERVPGTSRRNESPERVPVTSPRNESPE
jgi:hypothetical protein